MAVSKTLISVFAVLLVVGGGAAATGLAQTDETASSTTVSDLEMDATLDNGTVAVTVMDDGSPVENASITVEGDEEVHVTTDADGMATVDSAALVEDNESLDELEIEYESDHAEGELEFVVEDGSLTLVEEKYEYEVADEDDEEEEEDEDEGEAEDDEREEDEDESDEAEDDEAEEDEPENEDEPEEEDEDEYEDEEDEEDDDADEDV